MKKVIFDTETTGLDCFEDEILQFSAINENGEVLMDTYIKPINHTSWKSAERIHGITPETVEHCPTFNDIKQDIQDIFSNADELIAYNYTFDIRFLKQAGIVIPEDIKITDVMLDFAEVYGEWNDYFHDYKWQKLQTAAAYYRYVYKAHDSLEDVKATLYVYQQMQKRRA